MAEVASVATPADDGYIHPTRTCPVRLTTERGVHSRIHEYFFDMTGTVDKCGCDSVNLNVIAREGYNGELLLREITLMFDDVFFVEVGWALLDGNIYHDSAILTTDKGVVLTKDALTILKKIQARHRARYDDVFEKRKLQADNLFDERNEADKVLRSYSYTQAREMGPNLCRLLSNAQVGYHAMSGVSFYAGDAVKAVRKSFYGL